MSDIASAVVQQSVAKLPVFATVQRAYGAAVSNFGTFVKIAWFWSLVLLLLQWVSSVLLPSWMMNPSEIMQLDGRSLLLLSFAGLLNGLLILPLFASIAVTWHRVLLLGETPAPSAFMRLDTVVWAYVALAAALSVLRFGFSLPQMMVPMQPVVGDGLWVSLYRIAASIVSLSVLLLLPRLSLALPGRAIGDHAVGLGSAFTASRGNTWRLAWGAVLCFLPAILVGLLTFGVWPGRQIMMSDAPLAFYVRTGQSVLWPLLGIVFVSFLSYSYEHFFFRARLATLQRR